MGQVVALAGRRVDPPGGGVRRFPVENCERVRGELRQVLGGLGAVELVSAAACGADILALEVADELGLRRRVVLPSAPEIFRATSVIDRAGDWGARYDRIIAAVKAAGGLIVIRDAEAGDYFQTNHDILDEAARAAAGAGVPLVVIVVWNGFSRGDDDVTAHFLAEARQRALPVTEILTVDQAVDLAVDLAN
jgi:hypothetical protein